MAPNAAVTEPSRRGDGGGRCATGGVTGAALDDTTAELLVADAVLEGSAVAEVGAVVKVVAGAVLEGSAVAEVGAVVKVVEGSVVEVVAGAVVEGSVVEVVWGSGRGLLVVVPVDVPVGVGLAGSVASGTGPGAGMVPGVALVVGRVGRGCAVVARGLGGTAPGVGVRVAGGAGVGDAGPGGRGVPGVVRVAVVVGLLGGEGYAGGLLGRCGGVGAGIGELAGGEVPALGDGAGSGVTVVAVPRCCSGTMSVNGGIVGGRISVAACGGGVTSEVSPALVGEGGKAALELDLPEVDPPQGYAGGELGPLPGLCPPGRSPSAVTVCEPVCGSIRPPPAEEEVPGPAPPLIPGR